MRYYRSICLNRLSKAFITGAIFFTVILCLPRQCSAAQAQVDLTVGALMEMAGAVMPLIYIMVAVFIALIAGNIVFLISAWQLLPEALEERIRSLIDAKDYGAIQRLSTSRSKCIVGRSLCAGIKTGIDGQRHFDTVAALSVFQALADKFYLSSRVLKAFGIIALLVCIWALGAELIRFYTMLYERMAVVVGNYPFRKLFQEGAARLMVLAMGGLSVSVASLISGFVFSGAVRVVITRRTSALIQMLSEEIQPNRTGDLF